ncbi:MAG TPA: hypothetical protein VGB05_12460, partial [Pyrinomonadaceae bacterium]
MPAINQSKRERFRGARRWSLLQTVMLTLALVSAAGAQIAGPATPKKTGDAAKTPATVTQRVEREGIAIDFSLTPSGDKGLVAGADALATFRVTDARTGQPITNLHPNAWF